ncbi:MAG: hypothetical protein JST59_00195 [Actinobacteria bacterium]|nr:hypothetical protein [Actinomycetota bacterium]
MEVQSSDSDWQAFTDPSNAQVELQLAILKEYIARANEHTLDDLLAVREQNDLIRAVRQKLEVGGRSTSFLTETDESETTRGRLLTETSTNKRPNTKELFFGGKTRLATQSTEDVRVRRRQLSQTDIAAILSEIEEKCGKDVHEIVSQLANEHRLQKDRLVSARRDET